MKLDPQQQEAAFTHHSAVVSAGAGSGKTTILSRRFVYLVETGRASVDEILTLTFTRKAAAEMYERIYRELRNAVPDAAKAYDQATISTLDSFCARIVRDRSDRFGIPSDFVQDDQKAEDIARAAALETLLRHRGSDALEQYIDLFGFEGVLEGLFVALATRYFTFADTDGMGELLARQEEHLRSEIPRLLSGLDALSQQILRLDPGAHKQIADAHALFSEHDIGELFEAGVDRPDDLSVLLSQLTADLKKPRGRIAEGNVDALEYRDLVENWREGAGLAVSAAETLLAWPLFQELGEVIDRFRSSYEQEKRMTGIVTFRDVPAMAVRLLEEDPEFRSSWKHAFRYIMIDEFQDNNDLQRKLLYLLAERPERMEKGVPRADELVPGKLFFVGDEKQSIYRFRGAEVGVFKRLGEELVSAGGVSLDLSRNYRSEPALIGFFNDFFPRVFADADRSYEARFRPLSSREKTEGVSPRISLFYYPGSSEEEALPAPEAEAWYLARRIREMVEKKELTIAGGAADYGDIALLMRSSGNQISFERAFRRLGIPYTVQSARALFLEAPASDFYQLLQLALYPEDRLAYFSLLRSPFAALSDDVIAAVMLREQEIHAAPFALDPDDPILGDEGERYRLAGQAWRMVRQEADRVPISELIRRLWTGFGYRYAVLRNPDYHVYLEYYDYLFEFALLADRRGENLVTFLRFLRKNLGKYEKVEEVEPSRQEERGVRIMSIHKSKGLQFPVVFVAGCGSTGRREHEGASPFQLHPELGVTLSAPSRERKSGKANFFYRQGLELENEQEVAELKRLLYVAATRAECHLFFSGYHGRSNRKMDGLGRFALLNWIGKGFGAESDQWECDPAFESHIEIIPPVTIEEIERNVVSKRQGPPLPEAAEEYRKAEILAFPAPVEAFSPSLVSAAISRLSVPQMADLKGQRDLSASDSELPVDRYLGGEERITAFGSLCHRLIEEGITQGVVKGDVRDLPTPFRALSDKASSLILDTAVDLARSFMDAPFGRLARQEQQAGGSVSEVAFLFLTPAGRFVDGSIDLLLERGPDGGAEAVVVDFKSDRGDDPEHHLPQLAMYREAASHLTKKPVRTFLWYLRKKKAVEIETDGLDCDGLIDRYLELSDRSEDHSNSNR